MASLAKGLKNEAHKPRLTAAPAPAAERRQKRTESEVRPYNGLTLLAAEDNPTNQLVIEGALRLLGYRTHIVGDGAQAIQTLKNPEHGFAAALFDCQMPVLDGYEAARQLRGECGERQVEGAQVGCVHGTGGVLGVQHSGATLLLTRD